MEEGKSQRSTSLGLVSPPHVLEGAIEQQAVVDDAEPAASRAARRQAGRRSGVEAQAAPVLALQQPFKRISMPAQHQQPECLMFESVVCLATQLVLPQWAFHLNKFYT